jgi:hypothetical protein
VLVMEAYSLVWRKLLMRDCKALTTKVAINA